MMKEAGLVADTWLPAAYYATVRVLSAADFAVQLHRAAVQ